MVRVTFKKKTKVNIVRVTLLKTLHTYKMNTLKDY